jgi:hypothetical protein
MWDMLDRLEKQGSKAAEEPRAAERPPLVRDRAER